MNKMINNAQQYSGDIMGFDIGNVRIGVARINTIVKIAEPLPHLLVSEGDPHEQILELAGKYNAQALVFGLPRNLQGDETDQTRLVRAFVDKLQGYRELKLPLYFIDEAGTSKAADDRLNGDATISRDSMAAGIMLEDFVQLNDTSLLRIEPSRDTA